MLIRETHNGDGAELIKLMTKLDEETKFMMLEPGERQTTLEAQEQTIESFRASTSKVMLVAEDNEELVGFVVGIGNTANRNKHSMYCVIGIVQAAAGMSLGNG